MRAVYIAVTNVLMLLIFLMLPTKSKATTIQTGESHTGMVAICANMDDAATLIGMTTKHGLSTARGWMNEDHNTCALVPVAFTVGEVEVDGIKDRNGQAWMILGVMVADKQHYIVLPSAVFKSVTY